MIKNKDYDHVKNAIIESIPIIRSSSLMKANKHDFFSILLKRLRENIVKHSYIPYIVAATTSDLHLSWDVPYEPGTLKFAGTKNGKTVTEEIHTTSKPVAIRLSADQKDINADTRDVANVTEEIVDENGLVVPDADDLITFKVEGEATLAGTDNGDPQEKTVMNSLKEKPLTGCACGYTFH